MNVVQVIMVNAKNWRVAGVQLKCMYPHTYAMGCNTYTLNLVLRDWYKSDDIAWFIEAIESLVELLNSSRRNNEFLISTDHA